MLPPERDILLSTPTIMVNPGVLVAYSFPFPGNGGEPYREHERDSISFRTRIPIVTSSPLHRSRKALGHHGTYSFISSISGISVSILSSRCLDRSGNRQKRLNRCPQLSYRERMGYSGCPPPPFHILSRRSESTRASGVG